MKTDGQQRVYHFYQLAPIIIGKRKTDRRFERALSQLKQEGHSLVLHLASGERRPSSVRLRLFDDVVDDVVDACDPFHAPLRKFTQKHAMFEVTFNKEDCSLMFDTLNGSQQYTETFEAGGNLIKQLIAGKSGLEMIRSFGEGWSKLQIQWKAEASWPALHQEKGWSDRRCIWVAVGDSGKSRKDGRLNIVLNDTSAREVQRVTRKLRDGRPWLARRSGRGGRYTR